MCLVLLWKLKKSGKDALTAKRSPSRYPIFGKANRRMNTLPDLKGDARDFDHRVPVTKPPPLKIKKAKF